MGSLWVSAAKLESIVGQDAARIILRAYGGKQIYVRSKHGPNPEIADLIGTEKAMALSLAIGGSDILLPSGEVRPEPRKTRVAQLLEAGASPREAAEEVGVSARYAYDVRKGLGLSKGAIPRKRGRTAKSIILDMIRTGRKDQEIAKSCGVTAGYVQGVRKAIHSGAQT